MNRKILQIAIPSIVSNITVPLLGLVDVAIVGHLGATAYIGAIAVGGMLFSMLYWLFAFLRMGTSGMTAQAYGRRDLQEVLLVGERALAIGIGIALLMILLQEPILQGAFSWTEATDEVKAGAARYFHICVWGAPAVLGLYALSGWFIGMQNTRLPMLIAIVQNIVNIVGSLCFVFLLHMKIEGVAFGTLLAQYTGFLLGLALWLRYYGRLRRYQQGKFFWQAAAMRRFFAINRDIFLRTLCLVGVTTFFTSAGARQGEVILAVNTLLMQLFTLFSYFMDGFAYAGEALGGRFIGARNSQGLQHCVRLLFVWGIALAMGFTLLYAFGGQRFLGLLTNDQAVLAATVDYTPWAMAIPLCGFAAFIWDGFFIGATATGWMFRSMLIASGSFFLLFTGLHSYWGNHALWLAFLSYLTLRGVVQTWAWHFRVQVSIFKETNHP